MASDDTEITLGMGKLLGLFFLLAAVCGVFFSIGYSLGKSSGREQALNDLPAGAVAASSSDRIGSDDKPSAGIAAAKSADSEPTEVAKTPGNLTFYKAVKQNDTDTTTPAKEVVATEPPKPSSEAPSGKRAKEAATATAGVLKGPPEAKHSGVVTGPGTFVVQIAALSREDDAVALAGALRKKSYNVFVVNNPVTNDKLYHVQVGPFASLQDAEAMKLKLTGEGYTPIVKR